MNKQGNKMDSICPNCKIPLEELDEDTSTMNEGQEANYLAGFNHTYYCNKCKQVFDIDRPGEYYASIPDTEEKFTDQIDEEVFEDLIDRAKNNSCFIEAISLIHNVIEFYLKTMIQRHIFEKITTKFDKKLFDLENYEELREKLKETGYYHKISILESKHKSTNLKYLKDYKESCYMYDLIDKTMFDNITLFNALRNMAVHKLLKPKKKGTETKYYKYGEIVNAAIFGREIQLRLSPIKHSEEDIKNILNNFKKFSVDSDDLFIETK